MAMASALSPPRIPKPKSALPSHYHESFLEKKGPRDRVRQARELELLGGPGQVRHLSEPRFPHLVKCSGVGAG